MSESGDYDPGVWKGYDFKSARAKFDVHAGRSYDDAVKKDVKVGDLVPATLETDSESPLVIACDVTGSMGEWPATIFSKLPYLELEGKEYLGETMQISFAAVGDVFSDKYPLQVKPFVAGKDLEKNLKTFIVEGGGGGQTNESYDMGALYYARNVKMPKAVHPIFIFIGDEGLYDFVDKANAEAWAQTKLEQRLSIQDVIGELKQKFAVYLVRKPYGSFSDCGDSTNTRIQSQWEELLGADHVSILPEAGRVVDVIFGILAKETGRIKYFKKELMDRQKPEQVDVVLKSLHTIHKLAEPAKSQKKLPVGASMTRRKADSKAKGSISLV